MPTDLQQSHSITLTIPSGERHTQEFETSCLVAGRPKYFRKGRVCIPDAMTGAVLAVECRHGRTVSACNVDGYQLLIPVNPGEKTSEWFPAEAFCGLPLRLVSDEVEAADRQLHVQLMT